MTGIGRPRHGADFALQRAKQEIERLNAQIAMHRKHAAWLSGMIENWTDEETEQHDLAMSQSSDEWLEIHDQQVRDKALEDAALFCDDQRNVSGRLCAGTIRAMKVE